MGRGTFLITGDMQPIWLHITIYILNPLRLRRHRRGRLNIDFGGRTRMTITLCASEGGAMSSVNLLGGKGWLDFIDWGTYLNPDHCMC